MKQQKLILYVDAEQLAVMLQWKRQRKLAPLTKHHPGAEQEHFLVPAKMRLLQPLTGRNEKELDRSARQLLVVDQNQKKHHVQPNHPSHKLVIREVPLAALAQVLITKSLSQNQPASDVEEAAKAEVEPINLTISNKSDSRSKQSSMRDQ
jgi:hypothetical protein